MVLGGADGRARDFCRPSEFGAKGARVGFSYLDGKSWAEVTREERFFCQHLFCLLKKHGAPTFLAYVNRKVGIALSPDAAWEPAFEVCFYRDLRYLRGETGPLFSPKRTFDLCLFSEKAILIIEAKAQQSFDRDADQLTSFASDRDQVRELTKVSTYVIGLASSRCPATTACDQVFDGPLLTWRDLAELYDGDETLRRADAIYDPGQSGGWSKHNHGGYMTGVELLAAFARGDSLVVGRSGGLGGSRFADDTRSGSWRTQRYQTAPGSTPARPNWFRLEDFAEAVSASKSDGSS